MFNNQNPNAGFGMQQKPMTSLFGGQPTASTGFGGAFGQQQQPSTPLFGNSMPQSQGIGMSNFGGMGASNSSSLFGGQQNQSGFNQTNPTPGGLFGNQGQPIQNLNTFTTATSSLMGSKFGQTQSSGFSNYGSQNLQQQPIIGGYSKTPGIGGQQTQQPTLADGFYQKQIPSQQISSLNQTFQPKIETMNENLKNPSVGQSGQFHNIRVQNPDYAFVSNQMLKVLDKQASQGIPPNNFEYFSAQEYKNNPSAYIHNQKLGSSSQPQQQMQSQFGQQPSQGFMGQSQQNFGLQQQQQPGGMNSLFATKPTNSSFLGQGSSGGPSLFGGQSQSLGGIGGGLFNQTAQQTPTLGFQGQGTQPQQPGSFFGQPAMQQQNSSGLGFGALQNQGSLTKPFGVQQQQTPGFLQAQPAQGSLFGNQPAQQQQQQPSLFGSGQPQQQTQQSLFGQPQQPQQQNVLGQQSLFGNQQSSIGGGIMGQSILGGQQNKPSLFGDQKSVGNQPGSLFGQQQTNQNLFGTQNLGQPAQAQGSIFGGVQNSPQKPFAQSLFGPSSLGLGQQQPNQQLNLMGTQHNQQQQQNVNPYMNPGLRQDPYGVVNFLTEKSPFANTDEELQQLKQGALKDPSINAYIGTPLLSKQTSSYKQPAPSYDSLSNSDSQNDELTQRLHQKLQQKYEKAYQYIEPEVKGFRLGKETQSNQPINSIYSLQSHPNESTILKKSYSKHNNPLFNEISPPKIADYKPKIVDYNEDEEEEVVPQVSTKLIKVQIKFNELKNQPSYDFKINKTRDVFDLYENVKDYIQSKKLVDKKSSEFKLLYKNAILKENQSLKEAQLQSDATLYVNFIQQDENEQTDEEQGKKGKKSTIELMAPPEILPKQPKTGYQLSPQYFELARMTTSQLQKVKDFTISNEFGSIKFLGETDLASVNLERDVTIEKSSVEVYDDKNCPDKPQQGKKLNKPAIITLNNMKPKKGQSPVEKEEKLKNSLPKDVTRIDNKYFFQVIHLGFNYENFEWQFKVQHFTKYGVNDEDEEAQDEIEGDQQMDQQDLDDRESLSSFDRSSKLLNCLYQSGFQQEEEIPQMSFHVAPKTIQKKVTSYQQPEPIQKKSSFVVPFQQQTAYPPQVQSSEQDYENSSNASRRQRRQLNDDSSSVYSQRSYKNVVPDEMYISKTNRPIQDLLKDKKYEIEQRIKEKDEKFKIISRINQKFVVPTQVEVNKYLQDLLGNKEKARVMRIPFKPHFRPDGSLITLSQSANRHSVIQIQKNKLRENPSIIHITKIPQTKMTIDAEKNVYAPISDTLLKHANFKEHHQGINISSRLENLHLIPESEVSSDFISGLLEKLILPSLVFNKTPSGIYNLLFDITSVLADQLRKSTDKSVSDHVKQEFYNVCMINALFGNPESHIFKLHPSFKGCKIEMKTTDFQDSYSFAVDKKRKNAVTELLRFICQNEYDQGQISEKAQSDIVYVQVLKELLNGNLHSALSILNRNGKPKMGMYLTQAFSTSYTKELLKKDFAEHTKLYQNFNKEGRKIVNYMCGTFQVEKNWMQGLLYQLLVKADPTHGLRRCVADFNQESYKRINPDKNDNLMWVLLKLYSDLDTANVQTQLITFKNIIAIKGPKVQDSRTQWLTLFSLWSFSFYQKIHKGLYTSYTQISLSDQDISMVATKFIQQLQSIGDWQQALLVALYLPESFTKLKKKIIFEILQKNTTKFIDQDCETFLFLTKKLFINPELLHYCLGIFNQYRQHYESAIENWKTAKDYNQAHSLLISKIVPLYFKPGCGLDTLYYARQNLLNDLQELEKNKHSIINWQQKGQVLLNFLKMIQNEQMIEGTTSTIKEIAIQLQSDKNMQDAIQKVIWETLVDLDRKNKVTYCKSSYGNKRITMIIDQVAPLKEFVELYQNNQYLVKSLDEYVTENLLLLHNTKFEQAV